ncbi:MAG: epoxyqueuosine reductase [Defluviitaleaceae bacterium]|nr:epoxyqueuosine reductase [Defluviitaleaceae bacterium]
MNEKIRSELVKRGADIVKFVDITTFPKTQTMGLDKAIIFCMALSKKYIIDVIQNGIPPVEKDEYLLKEHNVEALADWLADYIRQKGYNAHSQSEKSNAENGYIERAYINPNLTQGVSILPQKSIARIAGMGFIGKNNLFITKEYGCAFCMCSVLTNMPVTTENRPVIILQCGTCDECVKNCPTKAIHGNTWDIGGGRESLVDVSKCCCALKCMIACPWTLKYANQ